jgi:MraZ protein
MKYFLGKYYHTLDAKHRLSIPSRFRKATGETLYLCRGLDRCLFLFPEEQWERFVSELMTLQLTSADARYFYRAIAPNAIDVTVDGHGRISIPPDLCELADLGGEVLVIGAFDHIEIWNPERFKSYGEDSDLSFEEVAETLWEKPRKGGGQGGPREE